MRVAFPGPKLIPADGTGMDGDWLVMLTGGSVPCISCASSSKKNSTTGREEREREREGGRGNPTCSTYLFAAMIHPSIYLGTSLCPVW